MHQPSDIFRLHDIRKMLNPAMKVKHGSSADAAKVVLGSAFTTGYDHYDYPPKRDHYDYLPNRGHLPQPLYDTPALGNSAFDFHYVNAGQLKESPYTDIATTTRDSPYMDMTGANPLRSPARDSPFMDMTGANPLRPVNPFPNLMPFGHTPTRNSSADTDIYSTPSDLGMRLRSVTSRDSGYVDATPPPTGPRDELPSYVSNRNAFERSMGKYKWEKEEKLLKQAREKKEKTSRIIAELSQGDFSDKSKRKLQTALNKRAKYESQIHHIEASLPEQTRMRSPKKTPVYYTRTESKASSVDSDVFI